MLRTNPDVSKCQDGLDDNTVSLIPVVSKCQDGLDDNTVSLIPVC